VPAVPIVTAETTLPGGWGSRNFSASWTAVKANCVGVLLEDSLRSPQVKGVMSIAGEAQHIWIVGDVLRMQR
jgi:hypothetical protein